MQTSEKIKVHRLVQFQVKLPHQRSPYALEFEELISAARFSKHSHLFVMSLPGVPVTRFPLVASSATCSLSRPSASSTPLALTRSNPCTSARWSGLSGCLGKPTPYTGSEPNICAYINEEHTPFNLPDSNRDFPRSDDAAIISTTEGPVGFQHSGASSSSKHTAASRVPTVLGSLRNGGFWVGWWS